MTLDIAAALQFISQLTAERDKAQQGFKTCDLPEGKRLILLPDGEMREVTVDGPNARDNVSDLPSLVRWIQSYATDAVIIKIAPSRITVDVDRHLRHDHDWCGMDFIASEAASALREWEAGIGHAKLMRLLRGELYQACDYVNTFRSLDFERSDKASGRINHDSESLGRSIEGRAQAAGGELPETVSFSLPLFNEPSCPMATLQYSLIVDAESRLLKILPQGDRVAEAMHETLLYYVSELSNTFKDSLVLMVD